MYQVSTLEGGSATAADRFLASSTATNATKSQRSTVDVLASLLRTSFDTDVTAQLRDVLSISDRRGYPTMDLLAAAEYEVLDELFTGTVSAARLHDAMISLNQQIERATHTIPALAA